MLKKNEPDWIEHDGSDVCPVPAEHDVGVRDRRGTTYRSRGCLCAWRHVTHYRDWTAFERQQASAGESVPYWAWKRAVELTGPNRSSSQVLQDFARYIAAHEPEPDALREVAEELARESQDLNLPLRKRVDWFEAQLRERGVTAPAAKGEG